MSVHSQAVRSRFVPNANTRQAPIGGNTTMESLMERGEQTPLLANHNTSASTQATRPVNPERPEIPSDAVLKEKAVTGFAVLGFVTSALSLIVESVSQHPSILISGVLGMLLSPYAAFQQRKISEVEALHQTNVLLEQELTHIKEENAKLSVQVQEVQTTVARLDSLEATMEAISALEGASLDKLQEQLDESKEILTHMHRNYQADILQNLVSVLLATDADQNMLLADEEIDDLIRNLEGIHGVQLKEDLLRKVIIEQGRSVDALMEVARNVISPPEQSGTVKPIFTYLE